MYQTKHRLIRNEKKKKYILSITVAQEVVSVRPYPWVNVAQRHILTWVWVSGVKGAPPQSISLTFPPRTCLAAPKTYLLQAGVS